MTSTTTSMPCGATCSACREQRKSDIVSGFAVDFRDLPDSHARAVAYFELHTLREWHLGFAEGVRRTRPSDLLISPRERDELSQQSAEALARVEAGIRAVDAALCAVSGSDPAWPPADTREELDLGAFEDGVMVAGICLTYATPLLVAQAAVAAKRVLATA